MSRGFIFIHGLPAAGKTSLCRRLSEIRRDVFFSNMPSSPAWGTEEWWNTCGDLYLDKGNGKWLLTEGVASNRASRDRFVTRALAYLHEQGGMAFDSVHVLYLEDPGSDILSARPYHLTVDLEDPGSDILSARPYRSTADYEILRRAISLGSSYDYSTFTCASGETLESLAVRLSQLIDSWAEGYSPKTMFSPVARRPAGHSHLTGGVRAPGAV